MLTMITGASSGIGEATARILGAEKHDLFLIARRLNRLTVLAEELRKQYGVRVEIACVDIRSYPSLVKVFDTHADYLKDLTLLVNNAGLAMGTDKIQDAAVADWDLMIDTNLKGLLYTTRLALPFMLKQGRGHLIHLGSVAGRWAYPGGNVYGATKSAVSLLTEGMRLDLSGKNIRVTEIKPGMAETEFSEVRFKDKAKAKAVYQGMSPLSARDVAEAILWASSRPEHVNIQEIVLYPTDQASTTQVFRRS